MRGLKGRFGGDEWGAWMGADTPPYNPFEGVPNAECGGGGDGVGDAINRLLLLAL
jgi:hypothetical protein